MLLTSQLSHQPPGSSSSLPPTMDVAVESELRTDSGIWVLARVLDPFIRPWVPSQHEKEDQHATG